MCTKIFQADKRSNNSLKLSKEVSPDIESFKVFPCLILLQYFPEVIQLKVQFNPISFSQPHFPFLSQDHELRIWSSEIMEIKDGKQSKIAKNLKSKFLNPFSGKE